MRDNRCIRPQNKKMFLDLLKLKDPKTMNTNTVLTSYIRMFVCVIVIVT